MSLWSRITYAFRSDRLNREIDEELDAHLVDAAAEGRDPAEARRALGSALQHREASRDLRLLPCLDSLRADAVFGWRQLAKRKVTSAAAVLSLALGIGACISAFRLIDAVLLRPLPVAHPERLYDVYRAEIGWDGKPGTFDGWAYPAFAQMRSAVRDQAELIAISYAGRTDLTFGRADDIEKAYTQYVSGRMFDAFGLRPALGRLFNESDDREPGAHPYAVLSHDYWTRRFARDPHVIGQSFQLGNRLFEIIGVAPEGFTGTEPGTMIDIFLPAMMNPYVTRSDSTWHRTLAVVKPGAALEPLRQRLDAISMAFERERAKGFTNMSRQSIANYLHKTVLFAPAASGVSGMQSENRRPLVALGILAGLVLLIACANVANLLTAQAAARAREMALRVSIGAGRWRLVQLVLVESALLALLAAAAGAAFAWWSVPLVVRMLQPARLELPADWRVCGFGLALALGVTLLFGLSPALRASSVKPASALRGGDDSHRHRGAMHALIAMQVAFCFLVLFVAGLFAVTFARLSHQPTGFSADRILTLDTVAERKQPVAVWDQALEHLRTVPGVEAAALAGWPLLGGYAQNNSISVNGGPPSDDLTYFLPVSPGWVNVMKIPMLSGANFRAGSPDPQAAIVNETFVKRYFNGVNPVGRFFDETGDGGDRTPHRIIGVTRDARYRGIRDRIPPVAYIPFADSLRGTFIVRTAARNSLALASVLRQEVRRARPELRVSNIRTQQEIDDALTVRERLLATLAAFFAAVALLLAGVGLYGVLDYSVVERRREIGIRIAIGAPAANISRLVTVQIFSMVAAGAIAGAALALATARYIQALLFEVRPSDPAAMALPACVILAAALVAAFPAVIRALHIDPAAMLRSE